MAQPPPYDRQQSFTLLAQVNPADPYTGTELDAEFNAVKLTIDEILANLARIQRDDGFLANATVGLDQLAASLTIGVNSPTMWATGTAYSKYDTAFNSTSLYKATVAHTSAALFATDLAASKWTLLAVFNTVTLNDGDVTTAKIADAAVTSVKIAGNAISTAKILDDAVTTAKILDANVTSAKLATNAVATAKIQDAAVTTAKIIDAAVTLAKMADIAAGTILGRLSGGTGVPIAATLAQVLAALDVVVGDSGAGGTKGLVPAPAAGDAAAKKFLRADGTWVAPTPNYSGAPDVVLQDQKVSGTDGGTFTSGADRTRVLNTEVRDPLGVCSLASNQFTLTAGTYYVEWEAPAANGVGVNQSMLYDVTGVAVVARGMSSNAQGTPGTLGLSVGCAVVTISGSNVFEIRHRCGSTVATTGFGYANSFGTEVFTIVKIWKDKAVG